MSWETARLMEVILPILIGLFHFYISITMMPGGTRTYLGPEEQRFSIEGSVGFSRALNSNQVAHPLDTASHMNCSRLVS